MVTKFLDLDRDRQNRLENRLDHLLDVVQATVLNKSSEKESNSQEPIITNLLPPPKLGAIPPKLDLVPPKPCRFPSTTGSPNVQATNQNNELTRPGVISPPARRIGSIWTKLGPVSQSPFVKAQQQLGFQTIPNLESRTQSSAERRILQEIRMNMDPKIVIEETATFLENERQLEEKIENAKIQSNMNHLLTAKKRLFSNCEPTAAMILSAAFLAYETEYIELVENARINSGNNDITRMCLRYLHQNQKKENDNLLAGQGDSYERLRKLNIDEKFVDEPSDSSTPAKPSAPPFELKPSIQQLAQLIMQSSRWRDLGQNKVKPLGNSKNDFVRREFLNDDLRREEEKRNDYRINALKREEIFNEEKKREIIQEEERRKREIQEEERRKRVIQEEERRKMEIQEEERRKRNYEIMKEEEKRRNILDNNEIILKDNNGVAILRDEIERKKNMKYRYNQEPDGTSKTLNWLQDRYSYGDQIAKINRAASRPIGFSVDDLNIIEARPMFERRENCRKVNIDERLRNRQNVHFCDDMGPFGQLKKNYSQRYYTWQNENKFFDNQAVLVPQNRDMIERYMREIELRRVNDSDDEEFLDTTTTMPAIPNSRGSTTSDGTSKTGKGTCVIS